MPIWEAVLLGIIQGLTEFLPISSTAHLLLARKLLGHSRPEDAFTTVIQMGTLFAVFAYFRTDIVRLAWGFLGDLRAVRIGATPEGRLAWLIILGTIPAGLAGVLFKKFLKEHFYTLAAIACVQIVFALLLALAEWWAWYQDKARPGRTVEQAGWRDALWVGLWQALALMPGGSRSGTTITGGLFAGLERPAAARFSFLLSLPIMLAAGAKELYDEYKQWKFGEPSLFASGDEVTALIVATAVSALVGYLSIAWLLRYLDHHSTAAFIFYRILLGEAILILLVAGVVRG